MRQQTAQWRDTARVSYGRFAPTAEVHLLPEVVKAYHAIRRENLYLRPSLAWRMALRGLGLIPGGRP